MSRFNGDDTDNRHVRAAVRAIATGQPVPPPPREPAAAAGWVDRAAAHSVLSVVAAAHLAAGHDVPPAARAAVFGALAQQERVIAELERVAQLLDGAGIAWAVFKGPVLALSIYSASRVRAFSDLDILVRADDLYRAEALLRTTGATLDEEQDWPEMSRVGLAEVAWTLPMGTQLDLHWHVVARADWRRSFRLATADLLDRAVRVRLVDGNADGDRAGSGEGSLVPTFDPLDTVVHLAVHGSMSGGHRLRWALDLHQALCRFDPDPVELAEWARRTGSELALYVMIDRAARHIDPRLRRFTPSKVMLGHRPGGATWRAVGRLSSSLWPPSAGLSRGLSGRAVFQATRHDTGSSLAELTRWRPVGRPSRGRAELPGSRSRGDREPGAVGRAGYDRYLRAVVADPSVALHPAAKE
jgi:hypothetical protein